MNVNHFKKSFFKNLGQLDNIHTLLENIPNLYFWVKNVEGKYVIVNRNIVEKCGHKDESEVIGKTDYDFFPQKLCDKYREDEKRIIEGEKAIINRVELVPEEDGTIKWHSTNKIPLFDTHSNVIGIAGITRVLDKTVSSGKKYVEMSNVIEHISKNFSSTIEVKTLAQLAGLSVSQFERKFKLYFKESPIKFIFKVRIAAACNELTSTRSAISQIAYSTGFYDQSYFSKRFFNHVGLTPKEYRKRYFSGIINL